MRFEFDHKTGTMQPKKDDNIYFAKSQGGGLIVDDKKFNIKYIIERDERITKLFGNFDKNSLNFYDMRDARMIADRVIRMFGRDHKYSDFHYFLKGYVMKENVVKSCSDFLNESIWSDIHKKSNGGVRIEDGEVVGKTDDGVVMVIPREAFEDGDLVEFGDNKFYTFKVDGEKAYVSVISDDHMDVYYMYDEDSEDIVNMVRCFDAEPSVREYNDFGVLRALMEQNEFDFSDMTNLKVVVKNSRVEFMWGQYKFLIYERRDDAISDAIDEEENFLGSEVFGKEDIERYRNVLGDDFLDERQMKDELESSYASYYDELNQEEAIDELINRNIISKDEDYFELDEDGDVDESLPKFDYQDYRDKYVDVRLDNIGDYIDEYLSNFGYGSIESYIDFGTLAKKIIETDGPESMLAGYDNVEREEHIDYTRYYIYRAE